MALVTSTGKAGNNGVRLSKPHALQLQRIQNDEKISEQKKVLKNDIKANMYASWNESLQETSQKTLKMKNDAIKEEIQLANKSLTEVRRAQLRQLLEAEHSQIEAELHSLGLAIHKDRL